MAFSGGRFKQLLKKYGTVALGVHFSVSAASITGLYVAIKNNADVESVFNKLHLPGVFSKDSPPPPPPPDLSPSSESFADETPLDANPPPPAVAEKKKLRNRTAELAASSGGALALAVICNKALIPIRVPITIALTPPIARFLARRKIIKSGV